jgi:S-adenosylmethionine:tRNA ribosyltransferase-isomerase
MRETKDGGGRVIAVGTTVVRALESSARGGHAEATELFITPGYRFQRLDSVITNFHQPGTTHLLLVEALLGRELLAKAYQHALANDYRFLSYGDGMFIL